MNPLDLLLAPPALLRRAFDDLHDIADLARRVAGMEDEIRVKVDEVDADVRRLIAEVARTRAAVEPLATHLQRVERQLDGLADELAPIALLDDIRRGIAPLESSMTSVRQSVDELEPMISDLDARIRQIEPRLAEMQDSVEPIGDLAERIPGNRRRRR